MAKTQTRIGLIVAAALIFLSVADAGGAVVGGRTAVQNLREDKEVQDLGKFSVDQYNRMIRKRAPHGSRGALEFREVVSAEEQVVSGLKYFLKISAAERGAARMFQAVVMVKPWMKTRGKQLSGFDPVKS